MKVKIRPTDYFSCRIVNKSTEFTLDKQLIYLSYFFYSYLFVIQYS